MCGTNLDTGVWCWTLTCTNKLRWSANVVFLCKPRRAVHMSSCRGAILLPFQCERSATSHDLPNKSRRQSNVYRASGNLVCRPAFRQPVLSVSVKFSPHADRLNRTWEYNTKYLLSEILVNCTIMTSCAPFYSPEVRILFLQKRHMLWRLLTRVAYIVHIASPTKTRLLLGSSYCHYTVFEAHDIFVMHFLRFRTTECHVPLSCKRMTNKGYAIPVWLNLPICLAFLRLGPCY